MLSGRIAPAASLRARWMAAPLMLAAAGAVLAGCGSSSSPSGSSAATGNAPASGAAAGTTVTANETEFHIALSQMSFTPGTYTFQAKNNGTFPHALTVEGPGVQNTTTNTLQPGQTGSITVALQSGTYTIFCPVDGHRGMGMTMQVTVGAAGSSSSSSPAATSGTGSAGGY